MIGIAMFCYLTKLDIMLLELPKAWPRVRSPTFGVYKASNYAAALLPPADIIEPDIRVLRKVRAKRSFTAHTEKHDFRRPILI